MSEDTLTMNRYTELDGIFTICDSYAERRHIASTLNANGAKVYHKTLSGEDYYEFPNLIITHTSVCGFTNKYETLVSVTEVSNREFLNLLINYSEYTITGESYVRKAKIYT